MSDLVNRFFCKTCGDPIGDGMAKNVVYFCDRQPADDASWCGKCFDRKPCGRGEHGEGCPTMMVGEATQSPQETARD